MPRICLLLVLAVGATMAEPGGAPLLRDGFEGGLSKWQPQGEGLQVSLEASDRGAGDMLRLDNSAGKGDAFIGIRAGPTAALLAFSFDARSARGKGRVGLHRYAGPIRWVEIGEEWQRVSVEMKSHETVPHWYIAVPAGGAVLVDDVELRAAAVVTDDEKRARLAAIRADSERSALAVFRSIRPVRPGKGAACSVRGRFPIGYFMVRETGDRKLPLDGIFAELAGAGVNLVHNSDFEDWPEHAANYAEINNNQRAKAYLDGAHAHGLRVAMGFDRMMVKRSNLEGVVERTRALQSHPGLFGWYLLDEPSANDTPPDITLRAYTAVRNADGAHPVVMTLDRRESIHDYLGSVDIIWTDAYPVSVASLFTVALPVETAISVSGGHKPVFAVIQLHNDDLYRVEASDIGHLIAHPRPPTVSEVRCMTYLAIAHGASGIVYFAYDAWKWGKAYEDAGRYAGIRRLTRELSSYSPWLLGDCRAKGAVPGAGGSLVSYLVRARKGGGRLLVAVNAFDRPSGPVRITLGSGQSVKLDLPAHGVLVRKLAR